MASGSDTKLPQSGIDLSAQFNAEKYKHAESATRPFAEIMVKKAGLDSFEGEASIFDAACRTGALEAELYAALPKEKWASTTVLAGDMNEGMVAYVKNRGHAEGWTGLETQVVDGLNAPVPEATFSHVFVNFAIFMLPMTSLQKGYSLLRPGGTIGVTTWAVLQWYDRIAEIHAQLGNLPPLPTHAEVMAKMNVGIHWEDPAAVGSALRAAGFEDVDVVVESKIAECPTPRVLAELMELPVKLMAAGWEEGRKEEWTKLILSRLEKQEEERGGVDKPVSLKFTGIVALGKKPAQ